VSSCSTRPGPYIYPALSLSPPALRFNDQFAIVHLLNSVINLLETEPYVIVIILISLDFSTDFDVVRHSTLLHKLAQLHIPDQIYNWLVGFFDDHSHSTVFREELSSLLYITANIVQGSVTGPAAYVVTPETSSPLCRETRCASTPTTRTSSSQPAMRRHGPQSSPTC